MSRLNTRNFRIFNSDKFYSNLNSLVKPALKNIKNDTDITFEH